MKFPLFYFRPTICWVDDDTLFTDAIKVSYEDHYSCLTFNNPEAASEFLNHYEAPTQKINFKQEITESDNFGVGDHLPVDIKISEILKLNKMEERKNEIALLIVDYNMPHMDGLELCRRVSSFPGKKILLTGDATHEKAIEAFNAGLIDRFIKKDYGVADKLKNHIDDLIYQYFCMQSANLISHIETSGPSLFTDDSFINFFKKWLVDNDIVEFYLINKFGSFYLKDKSGKLYCLVVMSESGKSDFIKLHEELRNEIPDLFNDISRGNKIPFFGIGVESWDVPISNWKNYMYESQIINGREKYYWAIVE